MKVRMLEDQAGVDLRKKNRELIPEGVNRIFNSYGWEWVLPDGRNNTLKMETILINNDIDGGKFIKSYTKAFELEDGTVVNCLGAVYKNPGGSPGMCFTLQEEYFEDEEKQDRIESLCSKEFEKFFYKKHPKYFNKAWREKANEMERVEN